MINTNLAFVRAFLEKLHLVLDPVLEENWSSEEQVLYISRVEDLFEQNCLQNRYFDCYTVRSIMKELSGNDKLFLYIALRLLAIDDPRYALPFVSYQSLLDKHSFKNNDQYFYFSNINDAMFAYEIDVKLTPGNPNRRLLYRKLNSKYKNNKLSLAEVCQKYIFRKPQEYHKRLKKRVQRHKGYRDHGSLGSDLSQTRRDQAQDWSILQKARDREQERDDLLSFCQAFQGWY